MKAQHPSDFQRVLGPFSSMCIVVGAIVGIGIFFTPEDVAKLTKSESLAMVAWALGGTIAMLGALTFAELGGMYPRTAGQYEILRDAYRPLVAFLYVFCNATIIQSGAIAIIAYYSALNFGLLVRGEILATHFNVMIAAVMIVSLSLANMRAVKLGAGVQNTTVVIKISTLLLITALAAVATSAGNGNLPTTSPAAEGKLGLVFAGLVPVLFAFGGWQHGLWIGGEIKNPQRNVPLAIIGGVFVVTLVYLLANWAFFKLLGYEGVINSQGGVAASSVGRVWQSGPQFIAGAIAISGFGVLNAQLLSGPRLICGMARDGKFFSPFATVHQKFATPIYSIVLLGGLGLTLLIVAGTTGTDRFGQLLNGVVLVDSVFFMLTGLALIILRRRIARNGQSQSSIRIPFFPLVPVLFVLGEMAVMIGAFLDPQYRPGAIIGLIGIAVAAACYLVFFRGNKNQQPA